MQNTFIKYYNSLWLQMPPQQTAEMGGKKKKMFTMPQINSSAIVSCIIERAKPVFVDMWQ